MTDAADTQTQSGAPPAGAAAGELAAGATPAWMAALPDELKADPTLARYPDVEKLARGTLDLRRQASSRVVVPGDGADEAAWNSFYDAVGRPKNPAAYDIPVPEGQDKATADAFRPVAHKLGLTGAQARQLAEWQNGQVAAAQAKWLADSAAEVESVRTETPGYDAKLAAAKRLAGELGVTAEIANQLDVKLGSANLLKLFIGLGEKFGEPQRHDGGGGDLAGGSGDAAKDLSNHMKDAGFREKINRGDVEATALYKRLETAAIEQAKSKGGGR